MIKQFGLLTIFCLVLYSCSQPVEQIIEVPPMMTEVTLREGIKDSVWFVEGDTRGCRFDTLRSSVKEIPDALVYSYFGLPEITNIGDIDGDGYDEIGFFSDACESDCSEYNVYSVKNGHWHELNEKPYVIMHAYQNLNPKPKIIEPTGDGRLKILQMKLDDVDAVCDTIIDPVFKVLPIAINTEYLNAYLSVEKNSIIGEWSHKSVPGVFVLLYFDGIPYLANIKDSVLVTITMMQEFESYDGYRAFEPTTNLYGERATGYYRIIGERLLERPLDGSGDDYWLEPVKYYTQE